MDQNGVGGLITMTGGTEALKMPLTSDSECGAARLIDTAYSIFSFVAHKCRACPDLFTTWNTCITMYFPHIISQVISFMECCHLAHLYPRSKHSWGYLKYREEIIAHSCIQKLNERKCTLQQQSQALAASSRIPSRPHAWKSIHLHTAMETFLIVTPEWQRRPRGGVVFCNQASHFPVCLFVSSIPGIPCLGCISLTAFPAPFLKVSSPLNCHFFCSRWPRREVFFTFDDDISMDFMAQGSGVLCLEPDTFLLKTFSDEREGFFLLFFWWM